MRWLGRVPYADGLRLQESLVEAHRRGRGTDTLLLLEHPPVITLGRSGRAEHVLADAGELRRAGIELFDVGRGGDATYHGPGQLVGYPVIALGADERDAHRYLRLLERVLIRTAASYGVTAARDPGLTGIWVGREKLAAIGVRLSTGWITSHGFALNVSTDLDGFSRIVPCGIDDRGVTSLARLLGSAPALEAVAARVSAELAAVLERAPVASSVPAERLAPPGGGAVS